MVVPFDSSVNVAFPHIIRAFDLPIPAIQWVVIAYTLTYAALTLVFGRVGDMLGYRRIFLIGSAWSTIAFLMCAAAPSYHWLLAARVMQGVGAALALSCGPALATSLYPESERTRVLGLYTMAFGIGGALGPVLAGQLVAWFGWPAGSGSAHRSPSPPLPWPGVCRDRPRTDRPGSTRQGRSCWWWRSARC
jgi:MFS family permease